MSPPSTSLRAPHSFPTRRSSDLNCGQSSAASGRVECWPQATKLTHTAAKKVSLKRRRPCFRDTFRSEEHTSELQSRGHLVCRLLLEKKKRRYLRDMLSQYT